MGREDQLFESLENKCVESFAALHSMPTHPFVATVWQLIAFVRVHLCQGRDWAKRCYVPLSPPSHYMAPPLSLPPTANVHAR